MRGKKVADVWGDIQSTAASAEQNYYFLLLLSACELRPWARLLSVAGKQKETWTCFHALQMNTARHGTSLWRSWASLARSDQTPLGFALLRRKYGFYYINVKRAMACWNVLLPCGLFYTAFNYAPSSFESLISARFSWSHIACPAVCTPVCGEISETCQRQQTLNCTRSISHLYQFSAQNKN